MSSLYPLHFKQIESTKKKQINWSVIEKKAKVVIPCLNLFPVKLHLNENWIGNKKTVRIAFHIVTQKIVMYQWT